MKERLDIGLEEYRKERWWEGLFNVVFVVVIGFVLGMCIGSVINVIN